MRIHRSVLSFAALLALPLLGDAPQVYQGHGAESVPATTLAKHAPKALPPELAMRIQRMMDVRAPGLGRVSLDGSKLYFGWSVTGTAQVWRLDGPNTFPVQLTGGQDRTSVVDLSNDGKTLVLERDRNGEENPGLYTMPSSGGGLSVKVSMPDSRRKALIEGTWDSTGLLLANADKLKAMAGKLAYMTNFA